MIIWLSSYPKSGNTFVRSLLASYFFTKDGSFDFDLLEKIRQFPDNVLFKNLGINSEDKHELAKNFINAQKEINKRDGKTLRFLKTHSVLKNEHGYLLTDINNSLGVIYIIRDPRSVIKSYANHMQILETQAFEVLKSYRYLTGGRGETLMGDWSSNYKSWKKFGKMDNYLLIKYEDLLNDTRSTFIKILEFINKLTNSKFTIEEDKFLNCINSTKFENLQNLELKNGFQEAVKQNGKKVTFFKYGKLNDGKNSLSPNLKKEVEKFFYKEMTELGYL